ncbi:MAG: thiamine pyrophosphate-dependent dehydrogenase E1 component subunit alpha [Planctomycetota bacterium]|jgi:pyruvate dehydrogenase E1 component alpha subunit/2-oxoisovalerate dehydrogenase E1 component alpha subunit
MDPTAVQTLIRPDGTLEGDAPDLTDDGLVDLLRWMLRIRLLDMRLLNMQRQGRIGFYGTATGEEASVIGSVAALEPDDLVFPALRQAGALLYRGFPLARYVAQCIGNSLDPAKGRQMPCHGSSRDLRVVSWSSVIGTQLSHAAGAAMAARIRGDRTVVAGYLGDGATSSAEFHVSLNFAAVYDAPVVFICQNNQWAISVPFAKQTASEGVAVKAVAYGIPGVRVDGNDVLAVHQAVAEAADRARAGSGPSLVECLTYRQMGHSSSDDPTRYRDEEEVEAWRQRDPVDRYVRFLAARGLWDHARTAELEREVAAEVAAAIATAEAAEPLAVETLFTDVYGSTPPQLVEQARTVADRQAGDGSSDGAFPL